MPSPGTSRSQERVQIDPGAGEEALRHVVASAGAPSADLAQHGLIYPTRYHVDPWVRMWDAIGVRKHLERLGAELPALEVHHAPS